MGICTQVSFKKEIQISLKTYVYIITPVDVALEAVITDFNFLNSLFFNFKKIVSLL